MPLASVLEAFLTTSLTTLAFFKGFHTKYVYADAFTWSYMEREAECIQRRASSSSSAAANSSSDVIVFLHGFSAIKESWVWIAGGMDRKHRVLVPDLPGHGATVPADAQLSYSVELQARRLHAFLDATVPHDQRVHLVGCSMGGMLAGAFAAEYPHRVHSLTMLCPGGLSMPHKSDALQLLEASGRNLLLAHTADDVLAMNALLSFRVRKLPRWFAGLIGDGRAKRLDVLTKIVRDCFANPTVLDAIVPRIQAPTLVLWGRNDRVLDVSCVDTIRAMATTRLDVRVLDACGHTIHHEKFRECTAAIIAFVGDQVGLANR